MSDAIFCFLCDSADDQPQKINYAKVVHVANFVLIDYIYHWTEYGSADRYMEIGLVDGTKVAFNDNQLQSILLLNLLRHVIDDPLKE